MRLVGVNIPDEKKVSIALTYIFGIGRSLAKKILTQAEISPEKRTKELTTEEINRIKEVIENNYRVEGELRREIFSNVKRLKDIKSYRGLRHLKRLPVRGQRTKHNSRTVRGNVRKTITSGKKPPPQKT